MKQHEAEASCAPEYQKSIPNGPSWMRGRCLAWAGDMIIVARQHMKLKLHALPNTRNQFQMGQAGWGEGVWRGLEI